MPQPDRSSLSTVPDTIQALSGEIAEVKGHVARIDGNLGSPAETIPAKFEGDPPIVRPATGLCATIARLAHDNEVTQEVLIREAKKRTRFTASAAGLAVLITALSNFLVAAHAWAPPIPSPNPPGVHP